MCNEIINDFKDYIVCLIESYGKCKFVGTLDVSYNLHTITCTIRGNDGYNIFTFMVDNDECTMKKVAEEIIRDSAFWKTDRYQLHQINGHGSKK